MGETDQGTESDEEREARLMCEMLSTCASGSKGSVIMWGRVRKYVCVSEV